MKLDNSLAVEITRPSFIAWRSLQNHYNRIKQLRLTFEQLKGSCSIRLFVEKTVIKLFDRVSSFCWFLSSRICQHLRTNTKSCSTQLNDTWLCDACALLEHAIKKFLTFYESYVPDQSTDKKGVNKQTNDIDQTKLPRIDITFHNPFISLKTFVFMSQNNTPLWLSRGLF